MVPAMEELPALAGERRFLMAGDSTLVSCQNLRAMIGARASFTAPASRACAGAGVLAGCDPGAAAAVDYLAQRDAGKPAGERGSCRLPEDTMVVTGKKKTDPDLGLRRVFVWPGARAGKHVAGRIAVITRQRRVGAYLKAAAGTDPATSRPTLEWHF
ncbi:MAG: hypothetical protein ACRDOH_26865, partial [Streptosporangiaceae bacterium]